MASAGSIFVDLLLNDSNYRRGLDNARRGTRQASEAWQKDINRTRDSFQAVISPIDNITSSVARLGGVIASALSVQQLVRYSDTWRQLEGRLKIVSGSMDDVRAAQEGLFEIAQRTRQPLEGITSFYTRLAQFIPEAERAQYDLLRVTESVASALAITGETGASATGALIQFTQAIATNFEAAGQEIRSLQEQAPRLAVALQRALGDGTQSLKQLQEQGVLTRQSVLNALGGIGEEGQRLREELGQVGLTVGQAFQRLDNAFLQFIGQSDAVNSATSSIALGIDGLSKNLDTVAQAGIAVGLVFGARMAAALAATGVAFAKATAEATAYQFALTRGVAVNTAYRASLVALSGAATLAGRALAFLGGPVGAALTLAGAAALYLSTQQSAASKAAQDHAEQLRKVTADADKTATSFNNLASASYNETLARLNNQLVTAQENIRDLNDELLNRPLGGFLDQFSAGRGEILRELQPIREEFRQGITDIDEYLEALYGLAARYPDFTPQVDAVKQQAQAFKASKLAADEAREAIARLNFVGPQLPSAAPSAGPSAPLQQAAKDAARAQEELARAYQKNLSLITGLSDETLRYQATQEDLIELERAGLINKQELAFALENLDEKYSDTTDAAKKWSDNITKYGERAAENIQDAFADFLFDPFKDGLRGMLSGFIEVIRRMAAEAASQRILDSLFGGSGGASGFFGNILGSLFGAAASAPIGAYAGSGINPAILPTFAEGGYLGPGQFGIAGEAGPELIYGGRSGMTITPNGGGGVTYNIDARGAGPGVEQRIANVLQQVQTLRRDVPRIAVNSVGDANIRGVQAVL